MSRLAKSRVKLDIAVNNEEVRRAFDKTYHDIAAKAHIKGFRPGKAPIGVIRMKYGAGIAREVIENLVEDAYRKAMEQYDLHPVGKGEITSEIPQISEESSFSFTMEVDVFPQCPIPEYAGLAVGTERYEVGESDVDAELARIAESRAEIEDKAKGVLEAEDLAVVDYEVFSEGASVENLKREGYSYDLKKPPFYPMFQDVLRGKTTGESFEVPATLPEQFFVSDLAGKDVVFKGQIVKMQKRNIPAINDEFVAGITDVKTVAEFRTRILEDMKGHAKNVESTKVRKKILDMLVDKTECEIPQSMLDAQIASMYEEFRRQISARFDFEEELAKMGKTPESLREEFAGDAEKSVRSQVLMREIAEKEKIEVSEEDINEALDGYARYYGADRETLRAYFEKNDEMSGVVSRVVRRKVLELLEKAANITVEKTLPFAEMKE